MKVGECFSSWEDFFSALDQFKDLEFHPFVKYSSRTTEKSNEDLQKNGRISKLFPTAKFHYSYCEFRCTHRGEFKTRSLGHKTCKSFKSGCKARVYASVDREMEAVVLKKLVVEHNHPTGPELYAHYPKVRLLTRDEEQVIAALSKSSNVSTKMLKEHVNAEFGKSVRLMDIRNVKRGRELRSVMEELTSVDVEVDLPRGGSLTDFLTPVSSESPCTTRLMAPNAGQGTGNSSRSISSRPAERKASAGSELLTLAQNRLLNTQNVREEDEYDTFSKTIGHKLRNLPKNQSIRKASAGSELLTLAQNRLLNTQNVREEDEYDTFSKTIGHKLRNLPKNQSIHAQKLISDIMYEAELGTLSRRTVIQKPGI